MGVLAAELKRRSASLVLVRSCDVSGFNNVTHAPLNHCLFWKIISLENLILTTETAYFENPSSPFFRFHSPL